MSKYKKWTLLRRRLALIMVFTTGGVAFLNLSWLRLGVPEHYSGGWGKVVIAVLFGCWFGYWAIAKAEGREG